MEGRIQLGGVVSLKKVGAEKAPLAWRIKNALRWTYLWGWFVTQLAKAFTKVTGVCTITSALSLRKRFADGHWVDYGIVSYRLVTDAGVAFLVDDWDLNTASGTNDITTLKYHALGTGTNSENVSDTALQTECTTSLNPDSTRGVGTQTQPAANQIRSTATLTFDGSAAVTEHGLFSATSTGTLWDRSVFSVVTMANGDSLQSQYTCTINSGG